jgi:hypothetical protein
LIKLLERMKCSHGARFCRGIDVTGTGARILRRKSEIAPHRHYGLSEVRRPKWAPEVGEKLAVVVTSATAAQESETRVTEYHFSQRYLCALV